MTQPSDREVRLSAWVHGRVHVVARGRRASCERLLELLRGGATPGSVDLVVDDWSEPGEPIEGFTER